MAGDIGIHIFDYLSFATGDTIARIRPVGRRFDKAPGETIGEYVLDADDSVAMTAELSGGALGVITATRFASGHLNDVLLNLHGTKGALRVSNSGELGRLEICVGDDLQTATWREVALTQVETNYQKFAKSVQNGTPMEPSFATATALQRLVDQAVSGVAD